MRRQVKQVHLTSIPWVYSFELQCGHYVDRKMYSHQNPKTMDCKTCDTRRRDTEYPARRIPCGAEGPAGNCPAGALRIHFGRRLT